MHSPQTQYRVATATAALMAALAACRDAPSAPVSRSGPSPSEPGFDIGDAVFGHGNPHFFFLPPMVPAPTYAGTADGTLSPQVTVCEWQPGPGRCGAVVADFGTQSGTGSQVVRYDAAAGQYILNWDTKTCLAGACTLDPAKVYRLRVFVGRSQLGFADLAIVSGGSQLKNEKTGDYVTLLDGRTLPVKFRIEQGAVAVLAPGAAAAVGPAGGSVVASGGAASLDFPVGAVAGTVSITIAPASAAPLGTVDGLAPIVDLGPTGTQFVSPVVLTLPYEPSKLPPGVPPSALAVYTADGTDGWRRVTGSVVDEASGTVSAPITHFSVYSVLVQPNTVTGTSTPATIDVGQTTTVTAQAFAYQTTPGQTICYPVYSNVRTGWLSWSYVQVGMQCYTSPPQTTYYRPANLAVSWSSSAPSVASVAPGPTYTSSAGVATSPPIAGLAGGTAAVIADAGGVTGSTPITVRANAALIVGVIAQNSPFDVYVMNPDGTNLRALAPSPDAEEEYADISWDATTVVFESSRSGAPRQVYKVRTDGTGLTQLVAMGSYSRMPRISPDGRKVLFYSDAEGRYNLYVVDINSVNAGIGGVQRITDNPADDAYGDWSPDQQRVVFSSNRTGSWQVFTRDLATGYERQLTFDAGDNTFPRWQPNGSRIVYRNQATSTMWLVDADNGQPALRVNPAASVDWPANWSPDGRKLLFVSASKLYTVNPDGTGTAPLTGTTENLIAQSWRDRAVPLPTPQSGLVALLSTRGSRPEAPTNDVFIMNPDGSNMRPLASMIDVQEEFPDLLPDRSAVVFGSTRTGSFQIFKVSTAGGAPTQLTNLGFYTRAPAVSPDGQRVAFYSDAEGRYNIYAVGIGATMAGLANVVKLTDDPADEILPDWAPAGQRIVYSSNRTGTYQLYVKDLVSGQERQVTSDAGDHVYAHWAPSGSRVAYVNTSGNATWVVDVDDGSAPRQLTPAGGGDGAADWSPDGQQLLFGTARAGLPYSQLYIVNADGTGLRRFSNTTEDLGAPSWR